MLLVDEKIVNAALEKTLSGSDLLRTNADQELIFLPSLKRAEEGIASRIKLLGASPQIRKGKAWSTGRAGPAQSAQRHLLRGQSGLCLETFA